MVGVPNEEKPPQPVSLTHRPPNADLVPVTGKDDWNTMAVRFGVSAPDLIELPRVPRKLVRPLIRAKSAGVYTIDERKIIEHPNFEVY